MRKQAAILSFLLLTIFSSVIAQRKNSVSVGMVAVANYEKGYDIIFKAPVLKTIPLSLEARLIRSKYLHTHTMSMLSCNYELKLTHKSDSSYTRGLFIEPIIGYMYGQVKYRKYHNEPYPEKNRYISAGESSHHILNTSIRLKYQWSIKTRVVISPWGAFSYRWMSGEYLQYRVHHKGFPKNPLDGFVASIGIRVGYAF